MSETRCMVSTVLRFHQATCKLLAMSPVVDEAARGLIDDRERRLGVRIPAAVAEWYVLRGAVDVLAGANGDHPRGADGLGEPLANWGGAPRDFVREGLLVVCTENQAVCHWAVPLNEGPDPRVLVERGGWGREPVWQLHAASFSNYVFALAWDRVAFALPYGLAAQDLPLRTEDVDLLERGFVQRQRTYAWPGATNYRFERPEQRVVIWDGDRQADWWLLAATDQALASLARHLWGCGQLATSLYGCGHNGHRAEEVVAGLRAVSD